MCTHPPCTPPSELRMNPGGLSSCAPRFRTLPARGAHARRLVYTPVSRCRVSLAGGTRAIFVYDINTKNKRRPLRGGFLALGGERVLRSLHHTRESARPPVPPWRIRVYGENTWKQHVSNEKHTHGTHGVGHACSASKDTKLALSRFRFAPHSGKVRSKNRRARSPT